MFERIYIFSPIDDGWIPVKKYIEEDFGGERGERPGLLGGLGRGGAAAHHPAAAQDHGDVKEVGDEETVPGADHPGRSCGHAAIA